MKNIYKKGFTLVEALLTVVIISIIALLILSLVDVMPNEDIALAKKSLNVTQRVVQELANNSDIYIDGTFDSIPSIVDTEADKRAYFCRQFADQLNIQVSGEICSDVTNATSTNLSQNTNNLPDIAGIDSNCTDSAVAFKTTDGIEWRKFLGRFENDTPYKVICVKVSSKAPVFGIAIRKDGKIVPGAILRDCLSAEPTSKHGTSCRL